MYYRVSSSDIDIFSIDVEAVSRFSDNVVGDFCSWAEAAFCAFFLDVSANWIQDVVGVGLENKNWKF